MAKSKHQITLEAMTDQQLKKYVEDMKQDIGGDAIAEAVWKHRQEGKKKETTLEKLDIATPETKETFLSKILGTGKKNPLVAEKDLWGPTTKGGWGNILKERVLNPMARSYLSSRTMGLGPYAIDLLKGDRDIAGALRSGFKPANVLRGANLIRNIKGGAGGLGGFGLGSAALLGIPALAYMMKDKWSEADLAARPYAQATEQFDPSGSLGKDPFGRNTRTTGGKTYRSKLLEEKAKIDKKIADQKEKGTFKEGSWWDENQKFTNNALTDLSKTVSETAAGEDIIEDIKKTGDGYKAPSIDDGISFGHEEGQVDPSFKQYIPKSEPVSPSYSEPVSPSYGGPDRGDVGGGGGYEAPSTPSGGGSWSGGGCFIAGTKVRMADGTDKNIQNIVVGDVVKGQNGDNEVITLNPTLLSDRKLYAFNESEHYFFTSEHPFMTEEGWKSIKPEKTKERDGVELYDQLKGELKVDDKLVTDNGLVKITEIKSKEMNDPKMPLYNFHVSNDNSYIANGYIVHNKAQGGRVDLIRGGRMDRPFTGRSRDI